MPGTSIDSIDYDNHEVASAIKEALNEDDKKQPQQVQIQEQPQPIQVQQPIPIQQPIQIQQPQAFPQPQPQPQQFYPNNNHQQFYNYPNNSTVFTITNKIKKIFSLFIIILLIFNPSFKKIIGNIPYTLNENMNGTFLMTIILGIITCIIFYIIDYIL